MRGYRGSRECRAARSPGGSGRCEKAEAWKAESGAKVEAARRWKKKDPKILETLRKLMEGETGGDPISGVKWSRRSTRKLAAELIRQGHRIARDTVGRLLGAQGFSLKANVKRLSGPRHPHREQQFQFIRKRTQAAGRKGIPALSVDTKKKEIIANYHNGGKIWVDKPIEVSDHDFPHPELGRANPFGIYDIRSKHGMVVVGTSAETAAFGVDALRVWYRTQGRVEYPEAREIQIFCDNGGCNGSKNRLWKYELQDFADEYNLAVHVTHYPPRASKWNPIEHRLFSFISKNWAGQPLNSYEKMLKYIRTTKTEAGLSVRASLLERHYETGIKISDDRMSEINLRWGRVLPQWNYTIRPRLN